MKNGLRSVYAGLGFIVFIVFWIVMLLKQDFKSFKGALRWD